ncbi:periplakin-like isoform X1 [Anguilla rostrata]|uniref:periplakin-like isoform X1 n=1 Tax=Anguilla rostrata TaxID=7938 RepID=UPI0030CC7B33
MFKKKSSKNSVTITEKKEPVSELTAVIDILQKNADRVEKNIYELEQNLNKDVTKINEGKAPLYQDENNRKIQNSLETLKNLDDDIAEAFRLSHPQAEMIKDDIKQLQQRVMKLCEEYEKIYAVTTRPEGLPTVDWGKIIEEKQENLNNKGFGSDLPTVENQVEEHNIFHCEVEALAPHITDCDEDYASTLQVKYNKLLASSGTRQQNLFSLRDYMMRCTNELYWLDQQAEERINYNWSDTNLDYLSRKRQYENFISKGLEAREASITKLSDDGEKLLAADHPGRNVIEAHMEAVHADWKEYLNLLICEENHLKHMQEYHKYHKDARDTEDMLKKLEAEFSQKYNPEFKDMYQIEGLISGLDDQVRAMGHYDDQVKDLQKRSLQVLPLKFRRETPVEPIPVEALCDFNTIDGQVVRGGTYTLLKNNGIKWDVKDSSGNKLSAPAVCFIIPPTDPEAIAVSETIANKQKAVKKQASSHKDILLTRLEDLKKEIHSGTDELEQQCRQLMAGLEKVTSDLDKQEKAIYTCVRPPLEQMRALQDNADRLQEFKEIKAIVQKIEPEKSSKIQEAQTFLATNPACASAPQLFTKVDEATKKYNKVNLLLACSEDKLVNSNQLETSLRNGKNVLSTFENTLVREEVAPSNLSALEKTQEDLLENGIELKSKKYAVSETEENLKAAKTSCENMANKLQEHCPDIERQEAEVQKLNTRFDNLSRQIDTRAQCLQRAKTGYINYRNDYDDLNTWLSRVPNYEPQETDDVKQVEVKMKNQRNLLSDIARKEVDLINMSKNAQMYQQAIKDYEAETEKFKSILDFEDGLVPQTYKKSRLESPAIKVKDEESAIEAKFTEVNAVNKQRLQSLEYALSLLNQQQEVPIVQQSVESDSSAVPGAEPWRIKKQLEDEIQRREQLEKEIETVQTDIYVLEGQKPEDVILKKEVVKKLPDPELDEDLNKVQQKLSEEQRSTRALENELEALRAKLCVIGKDKEENAQHFIVKEVVRIEKDKDQEEEIRRLKDELEELRRQKTIKENEIVKIRSQVETLGQEKSKDQEVIREEEVIKVQNDPELESEYRTLLESKQKELDSRRLLEDELRFLQEKLRRLEKERSMAEEKILVKEILKVEKDISFQRKVENLRSQLEDEKARHRSSQREKSDLQRKISSLEEEKSKVIIQEKMREIVRPEPKAENEAANLRLDLVEQQRRYRDTELQLKTLQDDLNLLRNKGPQIEVKEVIKEIIKYKTDPETERELEQLRNEIVEKAHQNEKSEMEIRQLKEEIQRWKDTNPQVQVKEVVNEVMQYREDPKTQDEVEILKRKLAEEQKKRLDLEREKSAHEEKIRMRKTDLSQVKEKVIVKEVVKMEEDPLLKSECQAFSENIINEQKQKDNLKDELSKLRRQKADLENQLEELEHERMTRLEAEREILRMRARLNDLEARDRKTMEKVTVQQKVVLQQDPQQEKEHSILRLELQEERHKRMLLEEELNALVQKQANLEKKGVQEKVVYSERVEVERDPETLLEINRLKSSLDDEKNRCNKLNQQLKDLNSRLSNMESSNTKSLQELEQVREDSTTLEKENQRLQNEIRRLKAENRITAKETKHIAESEPFENGNLELRLVSLQKELSDLTSVTKEKEQEIETLKKTLTTKREQRESHLRRSVIIIDPDTGKEMRPEEAYKLGIIDSKLFANLQGQECDWEEISLKGPSGESSVLHDRKSGHKFSIEDALKAGTITQRQLDRYLNKEITIQEFGLMVSGRRK